MSQLSRFVLSLLVVSFVLLGRTAAADPFEVRDLRVDVTAASAVEAQRQGLAEARLTAAKRLIERLTLPADRAAATQPIDPAAIARFYLSTDTQGDEKRTASRYIAVLSVRFDAKAVRAYLDERKVPFVETQAERALVSPATAAGLSPDVWARAWAGKEDATVLTPFVVSVEAWDRTPSWVDVEAEAAAVGARRVVVAEAFSQAGRILVRLMELRAGAAPSLLVQAGPFADPAQAQTGAVAALEDVWKTASIVRTEGSARMEATVSFSGVADWIRIRKALETSRMVSSLSIESLSTRGADVSFVYAGRADQLAADLRARGVDLTGEDNGWRLGALPAR
ncbi:MAG: hypothetical protein KGS00_10820 [Alphaproteobacteria bacterium]|nr:hypothetical protein [Alphaproteobacteria bacterium]